MALHDVVVVGGGLSGARAARDLGAAGHSVLLVEARDRLGGRVWTRPFVGRTELVELGGAWVAEQFHPHVAEELTRYGFALTTSHAGELDTRWSFHGRLDSSFPVKDLFALERVLFELIRASHRVDPNVPRDLQDLRDLDVSVETLMDDLHASREVREFIYMWAGLGSGALATEWSALTALSLIAAMDHSVFGWYGAVTDHFEIGMSAVVERIARTSGATVRLECPVVEVDQTGDEIVVRTRTGKQHASRHVVIAVPLAAWTDIEFAPPLPADKLEAARANHPGRMKKIWMVVEGMPPNVFASGWGTEFVQMFPEMSVHEGTLAIGMCAPPSELDPRDLDSVTRAVREFVPAARVLATDFHDWKSDPYSKGTWMVNPPGMLSRFHSALSRQEGRISFAGADIAIRWVGWLEGALEAGARAAREAISELSRQHGPQ
jgi:monoamine oxidase